MTQIRLGAITKVDTVSLCIKNGPLATAAWQPGGGDRQGAWEETSVPFRCAGLRA
jgi:hypothetical protein